MEKKAEKIIKKFTSRMQARLLLVFCIITLLLVGLMGRLIFIQQKDGSRYAKQVLSRQAYVSSVLPFQRGDILDCNGTVLAHSTLQYRLILDPKLLLQNKKCVTPTVKSLAEYFSMKESTINNILKDKPDSQYIVLKKNLKYNAVQKFKTMQKKSGNIAGVWFEEEYIRNYPYKTLASDLLGFTTSDNTGFFGIEEYYNSVLNGTNGREYGYYDSQLNLEKVVKKAVNGNSVVTTINSDVQRIVQEKIDEFNTEHGSKNLGILVMNPNDGSIIAMASGKNYNLNNPRSLKGVYSQKKLSKMTAKQKTEALNALWKNDAISSGFEPGSTFKPITVATALEENLVSEKSTFICDGGQDIDGTYIRCSNRAGHGKLTLGEALMYSCNDALMQIVGLEGKNTFYKYQKDFGMGQKTGIDLPGEASGIIVPLNNLGDVELATSSFGQTLNATMIQMAAAFSSLVNGGNYYQPHVMKQVVNDNGATVKEFNKILVRQTVSEKTSEFIQKYMYQTVEAGTAKGAQVKGYAIGGKTGTAQKLPRTAHKYLVSFLGCAPAINPQMVIYVVIDEPQKVVTQADSSLATKLAGKVLNEILPVLGIYPDGKIDYLLPTQAPTPAASKKKSGSNTAASDETAQTKSKSSKFNPDAIQ